MAWVHGKSTVIKIDGKDLSAYANSSELGRKVQTQNVTTYGSPNYTDGSKPNVYVGTLLDATGKVSGIYDNTVSTGPGAVLKGLRNKTVKLLRQIEGTGTGKPQESVDIIVTDYTETAPVADMVTWSAEFQCSGVIDETPQV